MYIISRSLELRMKNQGRNKGRAAGAAALSAIYKGR